LKPSPELGEQCASRGESILGRPDFSRYVKDKTVQTAWIVEQRHDLSARRG